MFGCKKENTIVYAFLSEEKKEQLATADSLQCRHNEASYISND